MLTAHNGADSAQPIIDIHTHVFPPKILKKAVASIGSFYDLQMHLDGTLQTLIDESIRAGITHSVIFSTATVKKQVSSIHEFIHGLQEASNGRLIGFGTLHPDMTFDEMQSEILHLQALHLRGIKLHPDFQKVPADSAAVFSIAQAAEGRLPIIIHAGDYRYDFSHPNQIRKLALAFPELIIIAAHFGGWSEWHKAPEALSGLPNVYVDTSSSLAFLSPEKAKELISCYGVDHVLFGSDYPMWGASEELSRLNRLGLCEKDMRMILYDNAAKLLALSSFSSAI